MDMEKLGTMTRGQIILQTDPTVSCKELKEKLALYEALDNIQGIKAKRKYMKQHDPSTGKDAKHGTYIVNYTGQMDWEEVADYIESYVLIVEGHVMLEVTSMGEKICVSSHGSMASDGTSGNNCKISLIESFGDDFLVKYLFSPSFRKANSQENASSTARGFNFRKPELKKRLFCPIRRTCKP